MDPSTSNGAPNFIKSGSNKRKRRRKKNTPSQVNRRKAYKILRRKRRKEAKKRCVRCLQRRCENHYQKKMCGEFL